MSKLKIVFSCKNCGILYQQWMGRCKSCNLWGTITENSITKESSLNQKIIYNKLSHQLHQEHIIQKITEISIEDESKFLTKDKEFNRVLGGGIVVGSVILIGGEPGVGKSTLLLQLALSLDYPVLYISGEESFTQIKIRSNRLKLTNSECYLYTETNIQNIIKEIQKFYLKLIIIDSIQTLQSSFIDYPAGSISQIRGCALELIFFAKKNKISIIILGHITKEGIIAGPKILEHMVDVVLQFEGDKNQLFRLLRSKKNRYGSTSEIGIYQMSDQGLQQILNPSEFLIFQRNEGISGSSVACILEGNRPILLEVQSLITSSISHTPTRSSVGFDEKRLNMLLAVLEKKCGFQLQKKDVFLNLTGGIKINDPAIDLAIVASIFSSNEEVILPNYCCFSGEIGLSGEIRPITKVEQRILEVEKLGYKIMFISKYSNINPKNYQIYIKKVDKIQHLLYILKNTII